MIELPEDLREMNEEQFVEVFNLLKERTKNWAEVDSELFRENPQFLFVFRIAFGLSQKEFAKKIGTTKQWVRHFEAKRQGFKISKVIPKCIKTIKKLVNNGGILEHNQIMETFKRHKNAIDKNFINFPEPRFRLKRITEMTCEDLKEHFEILKRETKNFTSFGPTLIISNPDFIPTFRVILNMNKDEFARAMGESPRHIRKWESFKERMMPEKAVKLMLNIESLFKKKNLFGNVRFESIIKNFERFSFFGPEEIKLKKLLEEGSISFDIHTDIKGVRKIMNVDFAIPSSSDPKIVIEVMKVSHRKRKDLNLRIAIIDHRFQLLKLSHPNLKTIMVINCVKEQKDLIQRICQREVVNTDVILINDIRRIVPKIKEAIKC